MRDLKIHLKKCLDKIKMPSVYAILLNGIILALMLLFFEPTSKSDDYDMTMILYGGFTGKLSPNLLYSNVVFGRVILALLTVFPHVSWYYILQYIGIYASLTVVTYIFIKKTKHFEWFVPTVIMLIFCGYEFYIRFTFSKTAGILIISGLLWILYLIEQEYFFGYKFIPGIALVLCGILVRNKMYILICAVFFASFIIYILKNKGSNTCIKGVICFIVMVIVLYACTNMLDSYNRYVHSKDPGWDNYFNVNATRAVLADYGWPSYEQYAREYEELGVSENDVKVWKNYCIINDTEVLSVEQLKAIRAITPIDGGKSFYVKVFKLMRNMLTYYFGDTGIYIFLFALLTLFYYGNRKNKRYEAGIISFCCLFAYIYMGLQGRLQHHVDLCVLVSGAILLIFYAFDEEHSYLLRKQYYVLTGILVVIFINKFYVSLISSCYYSDLFGIIQSQKERYAENKDTLSLLSEDTEHLYVFTALTTNWIYDAAWNIDEIVTPGFYHNMYITNRYGIPDMDQVLEDYQIKNAYKEMINSDIEYLVLNGATNDQINGINLYLQEHYSEDTYYLLAKQLDDIYVYRFFDGNIVPDWTNKKRIKNFNAESDIEMIQNEYGDYYVHGYAFIDGIDSYSQNICIEICDSLSGKKKYTYATQFENTELSECDKYHGRYSAFGAWISGESVSEDSIVNVYIETKDSIYKIAL